MATNRERKAQQRQRILDAAIRLFSQKGFKTTHVKAVAAAAGVSQVTLYKYFDSKLILGHQAIIEMIRQGYASFQQLIDNQQVSFPDIVKAMMAKKIQMSDQIHPDFYQFVVDEMHGSNPGSAVVKEAYEAGESEFWHTVIARGRAAGVINDDISDEALLLYLEMYVSYFTTVEVAPEKFKRLIDQLMHLFFYGFAGVPATAPNAQPTDKEEKP